MAAKPRTDSSSTSPLSALTKTSPSPARGQASGGEVGGYPYEFLAEPSSFHRCGICTQVMRDPHLTGCCGQEFCQTCLEKWRKSSQKQICPHCRAEKFQHMLNKRTQREISQLKVRCSKNKQGCEWTGELLDVDNHVKVCGFLEVLCDKCMMAVNRKDLKKHQTEECGCRASECIYCGQEDSYWVIVSLSHLSQCPGYLVNCPNSCGVSGLRRSLVPVHQTVCPFEVVECPFKDAGCLTSLPRRDMQKHSEATSQQHLQGLMVAFQQVKSSLSETQKQVTIQSQQLKELRMFRATLENSMKEVASEVDNLLAMKETVVKQSAVLHSIRNLAGTSVLRLNKEHPVISLTMGQYISYVQRSPAPAAASTSTLAKPQPSTTRTPVKAALPGHTPSNTGGASSTGKSGVWKSQAFYVGGGYKMCLQATTIGGSLSVTLLLQKGELDSDLQWPCCVEFNYIHLSLVSRNYFGALRYCLGAANDGSGAVLNTSLLMSVFSSEQIIWQHEKFARCPLPRHCVLEDGSITFRLTWIERKTMPTFSPGKEESRLVSSGVRRRRSGQRVSLSDESQDTEGATVRGFTFVYSRPSPVGGGSSVGTSPGQEKAVCHKD